MIFFYNYEAKKNTVINVLLEQIFLTLGNLVFFLILLYIQNLYFHLTILKKKIKIIIKEKENQNSEKST